MVFCIFGMPELSLPASGKGGRLSLCSVKHHCVFRNARFRDATRSIAMFSRSSAREFEVFPWWLGKHFELAMSVPVLIDTLMALRISGGCASGCNWCSSVAVLGCRTTSRSVGRKNALHLFAKSLRELRSRTSSGDNRRRCMNASF